MMASMKYTKMWILLSEYNFQVDAQKHRDLICCICKSLLKNAQQSICGCAFCFECIKNYLATDAKYCPGRSNGCKELMSNIERNMQIDHAANKKVANVIVTCPIEFCDFKTELKCMDEHIESHDDSSNHGKFLREPLEKLKKEISSLRDDLQLYKKDSLSKELTIMKIRDEIDSLKKTNDAVKSELNDLRVEMIKLSRNNDNCKEIEENNDDGGDDDDIDWQLEIFSDEIDPADFNASKKRKIIQEPARNKEVVSGRIPREIRELIAAEVKRNNESLRNVQIRLEEEIKLLKAKLQSQITDGKPFQLVKGGEDGDGASRVSAVAVEQAGKQEVQEEAGHVKSAAAAASSDGKTTRRKLRRELPQVKITPTKNEDQTSNTSKLGATSKPSSAAATVNKPSNSLGSSKNALKVVISSKPLHPLTLLRLDQKEKRAKMLPNFRSRAIFAAAADHNKKRMQRNNLIGSSISKSIISSGGGSSSSNLTTLIEPLHWMRNISPFEFRIDNFTDKHLQSKQGFNSNIFSQPFFSAKNGYKMCLRIDFDPNRSGFSTHVGAFFCLLRGEHDDHLPWPMKLEITISIIDQITFFPYTSRTFDYGSAPEHWKYVFHRPTIMQDQLWFGTPQFVHFDFIFKNPQLLLNDSILVRCSVSS